jgi:hypothetical protein
MKIHAFDYRWQEPAKTEKYAFEQLKALKPSIADTVYIAFPWATLIDALDRDVQLAKYLMDRLESLIQTKPKSKWTVSVCQHINFASHLNLFRTAGITDLYCSHAVTGNYLENSIRIWPFQLYPVQHPEDGDILNLQELSKFLQRKFDYSFIGAYTEGYITNARYLIFQHHSKNNNSYIKKRETWHFEQQVYKKQILGKNLTDQDLIIESQNGDEYKKIMKMSKFALCPSGAGPNTIRFWEAIEFGCIPILISNQMALPGVYGDWADAIIRIPEEEEYITQIPKIIISELKDLNRLTKKLNALSRIRRDFGRLNMVSHLVKNMQEQVLASSNLD